MKNVIYKVRFCNNGERKAHTAGIFRNREDAVALLNGLNDIYGSMGARLWIRRFNA